MTTELLLSLAALLISVLSTVAAIWAVQQTRVYRPQARWEPVWPHSRDQQAAAVKPMAVRMINHGSSTAYRVKLLVDSVVVDAASSPQRYEKNEWSVEPGDAIGLVVPLHRSVATYNPGTSRWSLAASDDEPVRPVLTLTWYEGNTSRQRSQRFRYPE
jgi:hypothetical protein